MNIAISNFDFSNGLVILRIICGLFFFPHLYFKIVGNPPPALGFFKAAGFPNPKFWMRVALVIELAVAVLLILGIFTPWVAIIAAAHLLVAAIAVNFANKQVKWLWNLGGMEFPVFWAICCVVVAMTSWGQA